MCRHRYSDKTTGYHQLKLSRAASPETGAAFKRYQSDLFVDVALCVEDLPSKLRPDSVDDFKMRAFGVNNGRVKRTNH